MRSTIGLKNVVYAILKTDIDGGATTYDTVAPLAGAIEAQITPERADPDVQFADDIEYDVVASDGAYAIEMELVGLDTATIAKLEGHKVDAQGGAIIKAGDTPPYIALGFKSQKAGAQGSYRYVWLYKCRPEMMAQGYRTREGDKITRQTAKLKLKAISRASDGLKQYITDTATQTFFDAPFTPTAV